MNCGILITCVLVALTHQASGQYFDYGRCPQTLNAPAVDLARYIDGPWYYTYLFDNVIEAGNTCSVETLVLRPDGNVNKTTTAIRNGRVRKINAVAYINEQGNGGTLVITLENGQPYTYSLNYVILETDYDNYAVAYACNPLFLGSNIQFSWILSRQPTLSPTSLQKVNAVLIRYGIPTNRYYNPYVAESQLNCPAFF